MHRVTFIDDSTAHVQVGQKSLRVEQASVILKQRDGEWYRVLVGSTKIGTRFHHVEFVIEPATFADRVIIIARSIIKSITPSRFYFRLQLGRAFDVVLAWG